MIEAIGFGILATCALVSAVFVVTSRRLVRAVLWLAVTLVATAGLYALLGASFLAGVQVLVYVGGVVTLMIFGIMLTRRHEGLAHETPLDTVRWGRAAIVPMTLFGAVALAIRTTPGLDAPARPAPNVTAADLGRAMLGPHVLAFEVMSFLLLAAIVGAVVIARRKDPSFVSRANRPGHAPQQPPSARANADAAPQEAE